MKRLLFMLLLILSGCGEGSIKTSLRDGFISPPDSVRPGVYWYFMDGCLSTTQMTKDLESMRDVGIGNVLFLEVNLGMPRGDVDYFSDEWQRRFMHAVRECERLGIDMTLGVGPGWSGSGGPWVKASESMRHIVGADTIVSGDGSMRKIALGKPDPRTPFFGEGGFTAELRDKWLEYYDDVAVIAFPVRENMSDIKDVDEKAIYYRAPYSSVKGVKPQLSEPSGVLLGGDLLPDDVVDLTNRIDADGVLSWSVPQGEWKIIRFGMRNNGAVTRPAPYPGLGFECDKFDSSAFSRHFAASYGKLMSQIAPSANKKGGLKTLHMDSWEMGAQNWSDDFAKEFELRRGYSPIKYLPVMLGIAVGGTEVSERFLWDLRKTAEEFVIEEHAGYIKRFAHSYGLKLSIEPYDMNPMSDIRLGEVADIPMCEFWTPKDGYNTTYSAFEASSIAHVQGKPVVASESFTTNWGTLGFANYPKTIKNQGDWAFAAGVNKFFYHTFVHKYFENEMARPGMTMGGYGVNWDRGQTWWHLSDDYHAYIARCSYMLQQGNTVADILYLTGEDSPYVFRPPFSALDNAFGFMPDRKGYNFDACSAEMLISGAKVDNGKIVFEGGASYYVLVLPMRNSMTPRLLSKIEELVSAGATIIGNPPSYSPSLTGYPECDNIIASGVSRVWGGYDVPLDEEFRKVGKGSVVWGGKFAQRDTTSLYPNYECVAELLKNNNIEEDFYSNSEEIRYTHRKKNGEDIFFIANRSDNTFNDLCRFKTTKRFAELWNPVTGEMYSLDIESDGKTAKTNIRFDNNQSWFVLFSDEYNPEFKKYVMFDTAQCRSVDISEQWNVKFDPLYGGVESVDFPRLTDWKDNADERIKYYSGSAFYSKKINLDGVSDKDVFLTFENVCNFAKVTVNGKKVATLWCTPWMLNISKEVNEGENIIEVEVANLWVNRLIGDESKPYDGVGADGKWPEWAMGQKERESGRYSYSTCGYYNSTSDLEPSGLIGKSVIYIR